MRSWGIEPGPPTQQNYLAPCLNHQATKTALLELENMLYYILRLSQPPRDSCVVCDSLGVWNAMEGHGLAYF